MPTGAVPTGGGLFDGESISVVIGSVNCFGNETDILQCSYLTDGFEEVSSCDPSQVAGVVCQGVPFVCTYVSTPPLSFCFFVHRPYHSIC